MVRTSRKIYNKSRGIFLDNSVQKKRDSKVVHGKNITDSCLIRNRFWYDANEGTREFVASAVEPQGSDLGLLFLRKDNKTECLMAAKFVKICH